MKNILTIGMAIALIPGTGQAQSSVQLYGTLDIGVDYATHSGARNSGVVRVDSGTLYGNRWGIRGGEDLGGGLKALFTAESGFALNNGASTQGGLLFGRQIFVGLQNQFGILTIGRQYTLDADLAPYHANVASRANDYTGLSHWVDRLADRVNNAIKYQTPKLNGFTFAGQYGFGGIAGNNAAMRILNGGGNYSQGTLGLGATYLRINDTNGNRLTGVAVVDGQYVFGPAAVHLAYTDTRGTAANTLCFSTCAARPNQVVRTFEVGLDYQATPAASFYTGGAYTRLDNDLTGNAIQFNLSGFYALSKRTGVYALAGYTRTTGLSGFSRVMVGAPDLGATAFASNAQGTPDRGNQLGLRIGMTQKF
ncbi:porin [Caballeronia sp. 15711]|uniref:porin n=1 Tax=Caballeronia sp. 15711 TaxID=3391029 RepID=UPI0039E2E8A0